MPHRSISVILPVYNEEDNIEFVVNSITGYLSEIIDNFEIILVNDGSVDKTAGIIESLSKGNPHIKSIRHPKNLGYGATLHSGFKIAQYPLVFFMDSDRQFEISDISKLLAHIDQYDIVIGARAARQDSFYRILIAKLFNYITCSLFKIKIKDMTCGFKLIKKSVLDSINIESKGGVISAEILIKAKSKNCLIKEVDIRHFPRKKGKPNGASLKVSLRKIYELINLWYRERLLVHKYD